MDYITHKIIIFITLKIQVMNQTIMESCPSWQMLKFLDLRGIKNVNYSSFDTF